MVSALLSDNCFLCREPYNRATKAQCTESDAGSDGGRIAISVMASTRYTVALEWVVLTVIVFSLGQ